MSSTTQTIPENLKPKVQTAREQLDAHVCEIVAWHFDPETGAYRCAKTPGTRSISGTQARQALKAGDPLPDWFMRDVVQDVLRSEIAGGGEVFVP